MPDIEKQPTSKPFGDASPHPACPNCGSAQSTEYNAPTFGKEPPVKARRCGNCGNVFAEVKSSA